MVTKQTIIQAIMHLRPTATAYPRDFTIDDNGAIMQWNVEGVTPPTRAEIIATAQAFDAAETAQQTEATALRQQIVTLAQGAVGKPLNTLTAAEVRALMAILLYKAGGVKGDATVRPLGEWVS